MKFSLLTMLCLFILSAWSMPTFAAPPKAIKPTKSTPVTLKAVKLEVTPLSIVLNNALASQKILITATLSDGTRRDVTDDAKFLSSVPKFAKVSEKGEVLPVSDGQTTITAQWGGQVGKASVTTKDSKVPVKISFVDDVVPVMSRLGCSMGTCHGAAQGKGGFRLSLRGYAPEIDFAQITRQLQGRRISREAPERSLFLRKPLAEVAHRGGKRLDKSTRDYALLLGWLKQGAEGPTGKEIPLAKLEILPGDRRMTPGEKQRLLVKATYADGRTADVTNLALFVSNDLALASVTENGLVTMLRSGESSVIAKYRDKLAVVRVMSPFNQPINPKAFSARANFIDDLVNAKLKDLHIEPSGRCSDAEYLRRAYVDAIGTLPTPEESKAFLDNTDPQKRAKLVDTLLTRPEYGMVWALKLGDLFVLRKEYMQRKYAMLMQQWLSEQFNANRPWDKLATDILTANGDIDSNRGGLFFVSRAPQKEGEGAWIRKPEATAEMAAQVFLGSRIQCAKCHNHPSEKYTQDDYYHYTALWQQVTGKGNQDDGVPEIIAATANGEVRQPRTNQLMEPRPLDRSVLAFVKDEDRRVKAAAWFVKQDEFTRNIVNRLWARCFGMGIVEPVDDIRSTNPASNEPLMKALCKELTARNFDLKYLLSVIMKSETYQRSAMTNKTNKIDLRYFSHYPARRLPSEELADAVAQVTGIADRYQQMPYGTRACEIADAEIPSIMLDTFGRPPRVQPSDTERTCNPAIAQALAMLNSAAIQDKIKDGNSTLSALLKSGKPDADVLETLYLSTFARRPDATEARTLLELVKKSPSREEGFQDVLWALLNSKEFLFNH